MRTCGARADSGSFKSRTSRGIEEVDATAFESLDQLAATVAPAATANPAASS